MPITCQVVTKTYYVHVIGPLRAYYVTHVTRYLNPLCNGLYYVHVIELVREVRHHEVNTSELDVSVLRRGVFGTAVWIEELEDHREQSTGDVHARLLLAAVLLRG